MSLTKQFKLKKGFRQGDPLVPFLFVYYSGYKSLAGLVRDALSKGLLESWVQMHWLTSNA